MTTTALAQLERTHTTVAKAAVRLANAVRAFEAVSTAEMFQRMTEARREFDEAAARVV